VEELLRREGRQSRGGGVRGDGSRKGGRVGGGGGRMVGERRVGRGGGEMGGGGLW